MIFAPPSVEDTEDSITLKANVLLNSTTSLGTILVLLYEADEVIVKRHSVNQTSANPNTSTEKVAKATKKFFQRPNLCTTPGKAKSLANFFSIRRVINSRLLCEITVWYQLPIIVQIISQSYAEPDESSSAAGSVSLPMEENKASDSSDEVKVLEIPLSHSVKPLRKIDLTTDASSDYTLRASTLAISSSNHVDLNQTNRKRPLCIEIKEEPYNDVSSSDHKRASTSLRSAGIVIYVDLTLE